MLKRLSLAAAILLFGVVHAHAQSDATSDGIGPFRFGLSMSEARAAIPNSAWDEVEIADGAVELSGAQMSVGNSTLFVRLIFVRNQLAKIELNRVVRVQSPQACFDIFQATVLGLEPIVGSLSGTPTPPAEGMPIIEQRQTVGGSNLRLYRSGSNIHIALAQSASGLLSARALIPPGSGELPWGCLQEVQAIPPRAFLAALGALERQSPSANGPTVEELERATLIEQPVWRPRRNVSESVFPPLALELGVGGEVELDCLVGEHGSLRCTVATEFPSGLGFGAAALRLSSGLQIEERIDGERTLVTAPHLGVRSHD